MKDALVELVVSWLPFVLLIGLWLFFSKRSLGATKFVEQQLAETRKMNVLLERIAVSLEKRNAPQ